MAILSQLRRRRVPQFFGIYLGASWAVIQFVDWMVSRYLLSRHLTDITLIGLVSLTPAILLLAYYHGAPGRQELGRAGKIGVPLNIVVSVALVAMFLHGRDLSATARNITVTDEDGQQVTRLIPTDSARRKAALFFWANDSGRDDLEWLRYGLPMVLARDLRQSPFLDIWSPYVGSIFTRLARAGFESGLDAPVGLQRKIATDWNLQYFVDGRFTAQDDQLEATITVYQTESGSPIAEHTVAGPNANAIADALTPLLRIEFDVPDSADRLTQDLPASELLTGNDDALRAFVEGFKARLLGNDLPAAITAYTKAVEIDPTFALAQFHLGDALFQTGNSEAAGVALDQALRHDYKLMDRDRFQVKGYRYVLDDQVDKRDALFEMWVELNPTDVTALSNLAGVYQWSGNRVADAKRIYQRIFDLHPVETWTLRRIAGLSQLEGDRAGALAALDRYASFHPEDHSVWTEIGAIHRGDGDLTSAQAAFEKSSMMASGVVDPALALADLAMRTGDLAEAERRLSEAEATAADAVQRATVLRARVGYERLRGRNQDAFDLIEPLADAEQQFRQPVDAIITVHINHVDLYHDTGNGDELEQIIDDAIAQLGEPFDRFLRLGYMMLAIVRKDPDTAERHRLIVEESLRAWNRADLDFLTEMARGQEHLLRGQYDDAIAAFESAITAFSGSVQSGGDDSLIVELQRQIAISRREAGDLDAAEASINQAIPLMPASPKLHLELAKIADARGRAAQAREHAEKALNIWTDADPTYEPAAEARALAAS